MGHGSQLPKAQSLKGWPVHHFSAQASYRCCWRSICKISRMWVTLPPHCAEMAQGRTASASHISGYHCLRCVAEGSLERDRSIVKSVAVQSPTGSLASADQSTCRVCAGPAHSKSSRLVARICALNKPSRVFCVFPQAHSHSQAVCTRKYTCLAVCHKGSLMLCLKSARVMRMY